MNRVGSFCFWPDAIVRKITRGNKGNWPRKQDRCERSSQAKRAAVKAMDTRADKGPALPRCSTPGCPARRRKTSPPCSKVAPLAEEKPANEAAKAGETMPKPKRKRPRLTPLAGAGSPKVRVKDLVPGRIGPTGETQRSDQPETTCLGDGASRRQRHGLPIAGTEDML